ncbi:MAG: beta-mannanase [Chthoniobacterales bacterium]|nr:MAG: beta-mannanase [Chthoniobacterales bacterium]
MAGGLRIFGCRSAALVLATSLLSVPACQKQATPPLRDPNAPVEVLLPEKGAYTGAFMDFGDAEDEVTLETIEEFESMVGKHQAIIASSSYWGEQSFPTQNLNVIWRHGAMPLVFWSPWDRPYTQNRGPDKFSLSEIVAGKWNAYIDKWGDSAREFGKPMIVVFGVEMNGDWFPWSGWFYGGEEWVDDTPDQWEGPEHFKKAYRYVVDRVRARGAKNVQWMFHTNNYSYPLDTWNFAPAYYPGSDYVDWLGMSVYGQQFKDEPNPDIPSLVDWPYQELCGLDPKKPVMIAEWATGDFPFSVEVHGMLKPEWIKQALEMFRTRYPRIKAAIYWHERWQNPDQTYSNLRVNSSVESLKAYRAGVAHPDWHGDLILRPLERK